MPNISDPMPEKAGIMMCLDMCSVETLVKFKQYQTRLYKYKLTWFPRFYTFCPWIFTICYFNVL